LNINIFASNGKDSACESNLLKNYEEKTKAGKCNFHDAPDVRFYLADSHDRSSRFLKIIT
jgi:hypothetical protein